MKKDFADGLVELFAHPLVKGAIPDLLEELGQLRSDVEALKALLTPEQLAAHAVDSAARAVRSQSNRLQLIRALEQISAEYEAEAARRSNGR